MKKKVLVLFSGGIDSTTCLALAIKKYGKSNVSTISIDYGQKNDKELNCSKEICKYYKVRNITMDLSNIYNFSNCSMLKDSTEKIPIETYDEQVIKLKENEDVKTNVPFRNGLMLSACTSYAISNNFDIIYYGIHTEDGIARKLYPDCDEDFNLAMNLAVYLGSGKKVKIEAPLSGILKKDVIALGNKLKVPFELTWTCYESKNVPCKLCTACRDRIKGFQENNLIDKLYER